MTAFALLEHYVEYIRSPTVLLTILIIAGPIALEVFKNKRLTKTSSSQRIEGCFRLGLLKRSNLTTQIEHKDYEGREQARDKKNSRPANAQIKALFTYPVKSCRGIELSASEVGSTGLKYDRLFTFAQLVTKQKDSKTSDGEAGFDDVSGEWVHEWRFVTQRDFPRLALLETELWVPDPQSKKSDQDQRRKSAQTKKASRRDDMGSSQTANSDLDNGARTNASGWSANGGCLIIRFPYDPDYNFLGLRTETVTISIPLAATSQRRQEKKHVLELLTIWTARLQAINVTSEIDPDDLAKLKYFLGVSNPLALFQVDPRNTRSVTRSLPSTSGRETYNVGFADAFPLHILSLGSVRALDDHMPAKSIDKGLLDARRFRANIYVTNSPAHDEDTWKRATIGRGIKRNNNGEFVEADGEYHVACRTARCKLPNVDQDTGLQDKNEPFTTLSRTRKVDKGAYPHPCLGMQMIPLFQQGIIRVGDQVEILERGEHHYEKMFP